jgi:hypothetical protein
VAAVSETFSDGFKIFIQVKGWTLDDVMYD